MKGVLSFRTLKLQLLLVVLRIFIPEAGARIIYVGPKETYDNIMYGLTAANPGDTVMVRDGVYVQEIKLREGVVLMAQNRHGAVIGDGSGTRALISIRQEPVDGAVIDGFRFAPGNYPAIFVGDMNFDNPPSNCKVINNLIEGRADGIKVSPSAINTTLSGNTIRDCSGNAITYGAYGKGKVSDNTLEDCGFWGIFFTEEEWPDEPQTVLVTGNTIRDNMHGGIGIERPNVTMKNNLVDGNQLGVGTNTGKSGIVLSDSNRVINNIEVGINIENGTSAQINSNTISGNGGHGIICWGTISVSGNFIDHNGESGIHVPTGIANISWNEITRSGMHGIELGNDAIGSEITHNLINDNENNGLLCYVPISIKANRMERNGLHGIMVAESVKNVEIVDQNIISANHGYGILLERGASGLIRDNEIDENWIHGIEIRDDAGKVEIKSNLIHDNREMGMLTLSGCLILENRFEDNGMHGILVTEPATGVQIKGNLIKGDWNGEEDTRDACGIYIEGSARLENNRIRQNNWCGIYIHETVHDVVVANQNQVMENRAGIEVTGPCLIEDNVISNNPERAIWIRSPAADVSLNQNKIENNWAGLTMQAGTEKVVVTGNIIRNNRKGIFSAGESRLRNNIIQFNVDYGIKIQNAAIDLGNATEADSGMNAILDNTDWNIMNATPDEIPAFCNYWGLLDAAEIDSTILDNEEDSGAGAVLFEPFLVEHSLGTAHKWPGMLHEERVSLQVYPNPLWHSTSIQFKLRKEGRVSLFITDVSGKMIRTLLSGQFLQPGNHSVQWDACTEPGERVPGGLYLLTLEIDQKRYSGKMIKL